MSLILQLISACVDAAEGSSLIPYSSLKFRPVLSQAKLQWPDSRTAVGYGQFEGFASEYFYLSEQGFLTFATAKGDYDDISRVELRQGPDEWKTSSKIQKRMFAELRCPRPDKVKEYTWLQIHDNPRKSGINKPLLRLLWRAKRAGKSDHLWAVVRTNKFAQGGSEPLWQDLGKRPEGFFKAEITVANNRLIVRINQQTMLDRDVSYWQEYSNYFKAGIYLSGSANDDVSPADKLLKIQFRELGFDLNGGNP